MPPSLALQASMTLASCILAVIAGSLPAADWPAPVSVPPRALGIDLPAGAVSKGKGETVTTLDEGQLTVGRLYVNIGENAIILLPDGRLVPRKKGEFSA